MQEEQKLIHDNDVYELVCLQNFKPIGVNGYARVKETAEVTLNELQVTKWFTA